MSAISNTGLAPRRARPLGDEPARPASTVTLGKVVKWTAIALAAMWLLDNPWRPTR